MENRSNSQFCHCRNNQKLINICFTLAFFHTTYVVKKLNYPRKSFVEKGVFFQAILPKVWMRIHQNPNNLVWFICVGCVLCDAYVMRTVCKSDACVMRMWCVLYACVMHVWWVCDGCVMGVRCVASWKSPISASQ